MADYESNNPTFEHSGYRDGAWWEQRGNTITPRTTSAGSPSEGGSANLAAQRMQSQIEQRAREYDKVIPQQYRGMNRDYQDK